MRRLSHLMLALAAGAVAVATAPSAEAGTLTTSDPATYRFVVGNATANPYPGPAVLTTQHVDIGVAHAVDGWDLHWHDETNDLEYEPDEALGSVPDAALVNRPAGSQWNFTGVGAGQAFHVLPQAPNASLLFLGVGAEEDELSILDAWDPGDARSFGNVSQSRVNLVSVTGLNGAAAPGVFSVWTTDGFGTPTILMSTQDGISAADALFVLSGGHAHFNYGFSAPGIYEVTIEGTTSVVPEPASLSLLGLGAVALLVRRKRRA